MEFFYNSSMYTSTDLIVTIWATYGPYHIARVRAFQKLFSKVCCFSYSLSDEEYPFFNIKDSTIEIINNSKTSEINSVYSFFRTFLLLCKYRPNLILSCGYERPETAASVIYSKIFYSKVFLFLVNQTDDKIRDQLIEFIKKIYIKLFDGILVGGNTHIKYLTSLGYSTERIATGYNCVDNDNIFSKVSYIRNNNIKSLSPYLNYFLCITRLIEKKNISTLIDAYLLYTNSIKNFENPWNLVICGAGPLEITIKAQVEALQLTDFIYFPGQIDEFDQVINYYSYAKALILPSNMNEQWGLVVNEAMAACLPVLVSRQCGCSQHLVQNGVNGFTFDGNCAQELADHMRWMHCNNEALPKMGEASEKIIANYTPDIFAKNILKLYQSLK